MSLPPHDYYEHPNGMPHLHTHDSALYLDRQIFGGDYDRSLPVISTIGKGPRGDGVYAKIIQNDEWGFVYGIFDEATNELIFQTPNIGAPNITIDTPSHKPVPGEVTHCYFNVAQGNKRYTYDLQIPPGEIGSRIYLYDKTLTETPDDTYSVKESELRFYGRQTWQFHHSTHEDSECRWEIGNKPAVRVNDIVILKVHHNGAIALSFGTVEAVEPVNGDVQDPLVVMTCRTYIDVPIPSIGSNGHWYVDGKDTGVKAQGIQGPKGDTGPQGPKGDRGAKGDKGEKGDTGARGVQGPKGERGLTGPQGIQGERGERGPQGVRGVQGYTGPQGERGLQGEKGEKGDRAKVVIGSTTVVEAGQDASVTAEYNYATNTTTLHFRIPEGPAGRAINIQEGIWYPDTLPPFDDVPINVAFIVYDGDGRFDLYIRGRRPWTAEDGGPWTVVEDWQGMSGYTYVPEIIEREEDGHTILHWTTDDPEGNVPDDLDLTDMMSLDYNNLQNLPTLNGQTIKGDIIIPPPTWDEVTEKPFSTVDTNQETSILRITGDELKASVTWDQVNDTPFDYLGESMTKNEDGALNVDEDWLTGKVENQVKDMDWDEFGELGDYLYITPEKRLDVNVEAIGAEKIRAMIEEITNV